MTKGEGDEDESGDGQLVVARLLHDRCTVSSDVTLANAPLSAITPPPSRGWLVSNPPYGVRLGERDRLRNLYAQLGNVARRKCPGWTMTLLSADAQLERQVGVNFEVLARTTNG